MKTILISCDTKDTLDWHIIKPLQGNYKKRTPEQVEKLCGLIIKRGIRFPSFITKIGDEVWANRLIYLTVIFLLDRNIKI